MADLEERQGNIRMVRDSADAVGGEDLARIRSLRFQAPGFDPAVWRDMCDLGWPGLRLAEERGGSGMGMFEFCALTEELGRRLTPEPLIEAAAAIAMLPDGDRDAALGGELIVLPAWQEDVGGIGGPATTRFHDGAVTGRKRFVPMAEGAHALVVATDVGMVLVRCDAPGVTMTAESTQDGGRAAEVVLDGAAGERLEASSEDWLDEAALATAAYLYGVAERAYEMTIDYLKVRKQFGKIIGSFQALQHRAADLKLRLALTKASIEAACSAYDDGASDEERRAAVSRAKARASDSAMLVTRDAIQLHGAIGYTDEHDVGLYLRKAMTLAGRYGSAREHRARYLLARQSQTAA